MAKLNHIRQSVGNLVVRAASMTGIAASMLLAPIQVANAGSFNFWGIDATYTLSANYGISQRLEDPSQRIINTPGRAEIPIGPTLKFPESNNFDDGNRNFEKGALVNNRLSLLGDIEFRWRDYGVLIRGDAFYDDVYSRENDNDAPDRLNTTQDPFNEFTDDIGSFSKRRARFLDAYAYGSWYFGDVMALQLRAGRHIAAWGQSLFFNGVALSMATADATKATVPGAEVKSILLPINQVSMTFTLTEKITLLGMYQFEHRPFELNPVGEFYSVADVVGPGAEFAFGIRNPFHPDTLGAFNATDFDDLREILVLLQAAADQPGAVPSQIDDVLAQLGGALGPLGLPGVSVPQDVTALLGASPGINPFFNGFVEPENEEQYGYGVEYQITDTTLLGAYYLNYHQKTPTVIFDYNGDTVLIPEQTLAGAVPFPAITAGDIGLTVPESYQVKYFDDVELYAIGASTLFMGVNIGFEALRREGADTLVNVNNGINGLVPTPTRADFNQVILNAIWTGGPKYFWDSIVLVGEVGWIKLTDVEEIPPDVPTNANNQGQDRYGIDDLPDGVTEEAWAVALLSFIDKRNVFPGWDMRITLPFQRQVRGRSALAGGFGSLFGARDTRTGFQIDFTRLQKLTLGFAWSVFSGADPHFFDAPLQDRDTISLNAKYTIF